MPSPLVLINGNSQVNGYNASASGTVTINLASTAGVFAWELLCIGTDELNTVENINNLLIINSASSYATLRMPSGLGQALIFQSTINNGTDVNGVVQSSYVTTFGVYVLTSGGLRVGAQNETIEGDIIFGWLSKLNPLIRS
jgi:hypothetical protein